MKSYTPLFITFLFLGFGFSSQAQKPVVNRIDPPFWWSGMEQDTLELLLYGEHLENTSATIQGENVQLLQYEIAENPRYAYLQVLTHNSPAQEFKIELHSGNKSKTVKYLLKERSGSSAHRESLTKNDILYLITPDRFANGDSKNDQFKSLNEKNIDRSNPYARHGGDLQGVINHLDYINSLGNTAIWLNPVLENNEFSASYHGYAITDHYIIDPRYGSFEDWTTLVTEMKKRKMKMVMDMVYNHFGDQHQLYLSPPSSDWYNRWPTFTQTNYRATTWFDPYASQKDKTQMADGWFDHHMPDVNQRNPHVAKWLIQNSIWWIEAGGVDAFRIDTYAYPDQQFMADLGKAVHREYPNFFIFGETWVHGTQVQSWFADKNPFRPFPSHMNSVTDFQFYFAVKEMLNSEPGWSNGVNKIYYTLAADYQYADPARLVTFVDNHDEGRYFGMANQNMDRYKIGLVILYTTRGIPCLYYGTEILMKETKGHGEMRQDFPGGWMDDTVNKFVATGRTALENEAFEFVSFLGNLRRDWNVLTDGQLMQFTPPSEGPYSYIRYTEEEGLLVIVNPSKKAVDVDAKRYDEILNGQRSFTSLPEQVSFTANDKIHLEPDSFLMLRFNRK